LDGDDLDTRRIDIAAEISDVPPTNNSRVLTTTTHAFFDARHPVGGASARVRIVHGRIAIAAVHTYSFDKGDHITNPGRNGTGPELIEVLAINHSIGRAIGQRGSGLVYHTKGSITRAAA
jgi:hypothetical protein